MTMNDTISIECDVTRQSVCMGDDATAPNGRHLTIELAADDGDPILTCLRFIVMDHGYLPSVHGGSSWIAKVDGTPAAIVIKRADDTISELIPIGDRSTLLDARGAFSDTKLAVHFAYYLNSDPALMARQLAAGERVERLYTPDAAWMA